MNVEFKLDERYFRFNTLVKKRLDRLIICT